MVRSERGRSRAHPPILLVDDTPDDVELTRLVFRQHRLRVRIVVARDGVEAVDYLWRRGRFSRRRPGHPRLVLLDNHLPRMDGAAVLARVKGDPEFCTVPVIEMLSNPEELEDRQSREPAADAWLIKPLEFEPFMDAVRRLGIAL
jgi:CheY-like chemotaxis protein